MINMRADLSFFYVFVAEAIIFFYYTINLFDIQKSMKKTIAVIISGYLTMYLASFLHISLINAELFLIINFILLLTMYDIKPFQAFIHALILSFSMCGTELLISLLFIGSFPEEQSLLYNIFIQAPLCKIAYLMTINIVIHIVNERKYKDQNVYSTYIALTIRSIFIFFFLYSLLNLITELPFDTASHIRIIANAFIILLLIVFSFWVYTYTLKKNEANTILEFQLQKEQNYRYYYQELLHEDEQQRILIHDIKNHLQSILALNENSDSEHIDSYIRHLLSDYELQSPAKISNNKLLNAIYSRYRILCIEKNISFHADIRKNCLTAFPDNELTSILCNLLDNAIEATNSIPDSYIELNIYNQHDFTYINVINTCLSSPFDVKTGKLFSKKQTGARPSVLHGLGIKSVEQIAERHEGAMEYHYAEDTGEFHVTLSLKE